LVHTFSMIGFKAIPLINHKKQSQKQEKKYIYKHEIENEHNQNL